MILLSRRLIAAATAATAAAAANAVTAATVPTVLEVPCKKKQLLSLVNATVVVEIQRET